jgi:hypothetical protein
MKYGYSTAKTGKKKQGAAVDLVVNYCGPKV